MESSADSPRTRRTGSLVAAGAVVALLAGGAIAAGLLFAGHRDHAPPPASKGGLVIDTSGAEAGKIDAGKPLRCFVQGHYVGELSLTQCAQRNGVATDALDVGLDASGALAAADQAGEAITPLPPQDAAPTPVTPSTPPVAMPAQAAATPRAGCWRYGGGHWRRAPGETTLDACVQMLFADRCERPGGALYGRFGDQTLRLVVGKVEVSDDNKTFRTLVEQGPDCALPPAG